MAILGLPGVKKDEIWVGRGLLDTHSPPEAFAGLGEAGSGARCVDGGLAKLAQNGPEGMWKLTGVWIG